MKTTLLIALFLFLPGLTATRADTLAEKASAAGADWIIGKWANEDGKASVSFSWKLGNNVIGVLFKLGDRETEGMILQKPGTNVVIYGGADNKGGMTTGRWMEYHGNPTLVSTHIDAAGTELKVAAEHIKTDASTMTVKLYGVDSDGNPDGVQAREVVFKRQP